MFNKSNESINPLRRELHIIICYFFQHFFFEIDFFRNDSIQLPTTNDSHVLSEEC